MCDNPVSDIVNVVANVSTGGLYSLGKAAVNTVESGNPTDLMTQGLDLGMASTGNQLAVDLGGPIAGQAFNAAGGLAGAAGGAGLFAGTEAEAASGADGITQSALNVGKDTGLGADPFSPAAGGGSDISSASQPLVSPSADTTLASAPDTTLAGNTPVVSDQSAVPNLSSQFGETGNQMVDQTGNMIHGAQATDVQSALSTMPENPAEVQGWWASMNPMVKGALIMAGGQLATGAAGGVFQGLNAQKQLALEQLINQQNQNQRQYLNRNNQYAPALKFKNPGMINAGGQ